MPHLLFNLQHVSEEEAEEVRALLHSHDIEFYETHAGRWRIGFAGIWLSHGEQKELALALIDDYQKQRSANALDERKRLEELGYLWAFVENLQQNPLKVLAALVGIIAVLAISLLPFISI